ncbi:ComEC/Rec2 family competence protein [Flavobacterium sp.]|uniref:ComEC/Rec2 family competence protein n=1 Tax=Flavobacterium sp. TaxID=239 RepID=UPI002621E526|nr:ComEC/Rec2 family competence protein [Flavobacterium sp.]
MKILKFPIVRVTFWFILGILAAFYFKISPTISFSFLGLSLMLFGFIYLKSNNDFNQKKNFGAALYALFFFIGMTTTVIHNDTFRKTHYIHNETYFEKNHQIKVVVKEKLKTTSKNDRYISEVIQIDGKNTTGKLLLNIKKDSIFKKISIGNQLLIEDQLVKNFKPNNPNQFDYGQYLETKGIYAQLFTETQQLKISNAIEKDIWYYSANFRNRIIQNLSKKGFKKEELAVVIALILGQQQDISPEIIRDYQYAGAVHILSVSGLHVGFILLFITFLLKPLPKTKYSNFIRLIIVLISLWLFSIVAGLAPSVVRSAAMFSFVAVGMFLNRETNMYHTTIVSLFLILLVEPLFLFDIGFQLSYIALFFILWLQPMLKTLWKPKNVIVSYFWDILTVSFAAQIGALPLSIYYFHQFPGLFFVTNVVLIPCLSIVMVFGVVLIILAFFDFIPLFLSKIVEISITLMNGFIKWVASIESFVIKDIPLSFSLLIASYLIIFTWIIWFKKPSYYKMLSALCTVFVFQLLFMHANYLEEKKKEFIVFNVAKKTIIAERNGKEITVLTNDTLTETSFEKKMIQSYATGNFCKLKRFESIRNNYFFKNNKILIVDKTSIFNTSIKPDIIVLRSSPKINLERLLSKMNPKMIVADASNYKSYVSAWKTSCIKEKIPFHSTYEKGFYKID